MPRRRAVRRRRRTRKTTGGDKQPQYVFGNTTGLGVNTYASTILEVPLLNILTGGTKVLEILKIDIQRMSGSGQALFAIGSRNLNNVATSTYAYSSVGNDRSFFANTIINSGNNTYSFDLTDEAGRGQLYPAQQVLVNMLATAGEIWQTRILYRIRNATMPEYVGIINQYVVTNL